MTLKNKSLQVAAFLCIGLLLLPFVGIAGDNIDFTDQIKGIKEISFDQPKEALKLIDDILDGQASSLTKLEIADLYLLSLELLEKDNRNEELRKRAFAAIVTYEELSMTAKVVEVKIALYFSYYFGGDPEEAGRVIKEAHSIAKKNNLSTQLIQAQSYLAENLTDYGDYSHALKYANHTLKLIDSLQCCEKFRVPALKTVSLVYQETGNPEKGISYIFEALEVSKIPGNEEYLANLNYMIGSYYFEKGDITKARKYYEDSYSAGLLHNKAHIEMVSFILGEFYLKTKDYDDAFQMLKKSRSLFIEGEDSVMEAFSSGYLGVADIALGNYAEGAYLIRNAQKIVEDIEMDSDKRGYYELITNVAYEHSIHDLSSEYSLKLRELDKKIYENKTNQSLLVLQTQMETSEKEHEIEQLKNEQITSRKVLSLFILLGLLSVLLIFILGFSQGLLKDKNKKLNVAKEEAEFAVKAKADFLATMSHEIRTPMNGVIGMTNILMDNNPRADQLRDLETLKFSADNLLNLINDVLNLEKIESGNLDLEKQDFGLKGYLTKTFSIFQSTNKKPKVNLELQLDLDELKHQVCSDQLRLNQVLTNLVNNALKFTDSGSVKIKANLLQQSDTNARVRFAVVDTGIGISKINQDQIFKKYKQARTDTSRLYGGTGLGLAISKELVSQFGSELKVESQEKMGSTFFFELDFSLSDSVIASLKPEKAVSLSSFEGMKILVAEDNKVNQIVIQRILQSWGAVVTIANDGQEAVLVAEENDYDIVLMDIQMPIMDGFEATKRIRKLKDEQGTIPIYALTASSLEIFNHSNQHLMNGIITKPFKPDELAEILKSHYRNKTQQSNS